MKRKSNNFIYLLFVFIAFITLNSGCPHKHIQAYSPIVPGSISGTVKTFDSTSPEGAVVFVTTDDLLKICVAKQTVGADGGFSLENIAPGLYYVSAYKDLKDDGTYTINEDYLGGKLIDSWDLDNSYYIEVKEAEGKVIDIPLLAPLKMNLIENGTNSVDLKPVFSWAAVSDAAFYRLRVTSRSKSFWVAETPHTAKTYGTQAETGETIICSPSQLETETEYFWTVIAYKEKYVPMAYGALSRFYTRLLRTDKFGRIEILQ